LCEQGRSLVAEIGVEKSEQIDIAYRLDAIRVHDQPRFEKAAAEGLIGKIFMIGVGDAESKALRPIG
jgi:hypothetical protein